MSKEYKLIGVKEDKHFEYYAKQSPVPKDFGEGLSCKDCGSSFETGEIIHEVTYRIREEEYTSDKELEKRKELICDDCIEFYETDNPYDVTADKLGVYKDASVGAVTCTFHRGHMHKCESCGKYVQLLGNKMIIFYYNETIVCKECALQQVSGDTQLAHKINVL